ncbi:protein NATD1 [Drosophila innubila]|uniref:protein NATD1 n=1 Tax=Drosophila innubila TaxID=198719 RepID=UPI00148E5D57|nr:protein NATD1 [Drosophila innubila]
MSHLKFCQQSQNFSVIKKPDVLLPNSKVLTHCRSMSTSFKIKHDDSRFFIETKEGVAQLKYEINDGIMDIKHTGVPRALGGHGIGKLLAKAALDYGVQHGLIIKISCSFVKDYVFNYGPQYEKHIMH